MTPPQLPFVATGEDEVEVTVLDLGLARALWDGVAAARLLARIRLHRDERDLVGFDLRASGVELDDASWDILLAQLLAGSPSSLERLKRAVARHARAASNEGPLAASDPCVAALVHALLSALDVDASPAEGANEAAAVDESVRLACARFDERLGPASADRRAAYFEACLELARRATSPAWPLAALEAACAALAAVQTAHDTTSYPDLTELPIALHASSTPLYPWSDDGEVAVSDRRACVIDRPSVERLILRPERDLSAAIARAGRRYPGLPIAAIIADLSACLTKHGALLLVATREPRSRREPARLPPASWAPVNFDSQETAITLADALERGALTAPRARSILVRGGDVALDAIGKEMLNVSAHPFASAVFAELLAPLARERDVVRLIGYFAIAPDPRDAARALDLCSAREVVAAVLKAWLETMLPVDGTAVAPDADPATSRSARLASCIAALRPYPALFQVAEPLLSRVNDLARD